MFGVRPSVFVLTLLVGYASGCVTRADAPKDRMIVTEDDFAGLVMDVVCNDMQGCCEKKGYDFDQTTCEFSVFFSFASDFHLAAERGSRLRAIWNQEAAQECLEGLREVVNACEEIAWDVEACHNVYAPQVGLAASCWVSVECIGADGAPGFCYQPSPDAEERICGQIVTRAEGQSCDKDVNLCGPALRCDGTTKICVKAAAFGQACTYSSDCVGDAYCDKSTCVARRDDGKICEEHEQCSSDYCVGGECMPADAAQYCGG